MKKILGIMLVLSAFLIGAPHHADAQGRHLGWYKHRERARVIYYRRPIIYRRYYYSEPYYYHPHRVHIHVRVPGVGGDAGVHVGPIHVGAGVHLNEVMPSPAGPAADPSGISHEVSEVPFFPADSASLSQVAVREDTNPNTYYLNWTAPRTVTVDGFTVPVTGETMHFSLFKHHTEYPFYIHNTKGEDPTARFGVSPRGGNIPQSIGGSGLPATTFQ